MDDQTDDAPREHRLKQPRDVGEFKAICEGALESMLGAPETEIGQYRLRNLRAYRAEPVGEFAAPDIIDRSSIVSTDVRDTVNWMKPVLMKTFLGTDNAVEFTATTQKGEPQAKLITEYVNYCFRQRNPGFSITSQWFDDALVEKVGFLKVWWQEEMEDSREDFEALSTEQVMLLQQHPGVELIGEPEQVTPDTPPSEQDPMGLPGTWRVSIKRTKDKSKVCVVPCPPEEVRISRRARYSEPVDCIAHVFQKPRYELADLGYDVEGAGGGIGHLAEFSEETQERMSVRIDQTHGAAHESMQLYECTELYIRYDFDEDGVTEWCRVFMIGGEVYDNEKVDDHPFVWICPVPRPHTFYGECPADYAIAPQKLHTQMIRAQVDNINLSVNTRMGVVDGQVNLEDALDSTPGGFVRVKEQGAIFPIESPDMTAGAARLIEYAEGWLENTTGWTRYSQGTDANALNKTATGISIITQKSDMRMELISRFFAEGFKDLFRKMLKLITEHQNVPEMVKIGGQWVNIDPSEWDDEYELSINVGLGTGDRQGQLQKAQMLIQNIGQLLSTGVTTPQNLQAAEKYFMGALDLSQPELYYNAGPLQPQQQPPNPDAIKAQQAQAAQQQDMQHEAAMAAAKHDADQMKFDREERMAIAKMQFDLQLKQYEIDARSRTELEKAKITANASIEVASISANARGDAAVTNLQGTVVTAAQEHAHNLLTQQNAQRHDALMAAAGHDAAMQQHGSNAEPAGDGQ